VFLKEVPFLLPPVNKEGGEREGFSCIPVAFPSINIEGNVRE